MKNKINHKKFIQEIAFEAGEILLKYFGKVRKIEKKIGAGIVTEADKNAEKYLLNKISHVYPDSSFIAEESGRKAGNSPYCWVIDPLDGTSNFAHGFPWFCVSIGLYHDGKPLVGVIYQPILKEMFYAEKGKGAFLNGKKIKVSKESQMDDALIGTGFYYSRAETLRKEMAIFHRMNEVVLAVRRPGSAAMDLAYVACGRYDGFWERGLSPWDVAAGFLIVEEAGGKITDYSSKKTDLFGKEVVASNVKIHNKMIQVIQS